MNPAKRVLADIRELAPKITARAAEIENRRQLPPDILKTLRSIGAFRLFVPQSHNGLELDLPEALEIIAALARIDGALGFAVGISNGNDLFAALLPLETYQLIYQEGPDVIIAGSVTPAGTAETADVGSRVSGRWQFTSGCQHADWTFGFCVLTERGEPIADQNGMPMVRGFFLPTRDWQMEDAWYAPGLKGAGSHHIGLKDTLIPTANMFDLADGGPCQSGPLYQAVPQLVPLLHAAICVGIAEGALDELIVHANTGRQQQVDKPIWRTELFQNKIGQLAADLRAARAFLLVQAIGHWRHARAGTLRDEALLIQSAQTAIWLATTCARLADASFALAGGSALDDASPLQRRLLDLRAAAQHAIAQQRNYASAGKLLLDSFLDLRTDCKGRNRRLNSRRESSSANALDSHDASEACRITQSGE